MTFTLVDNKGNEQTVELDAVPHNGEAVRFVNDEGQTMTVGVHEVTHVDGGGIIVETRDGFVAR